jgi:hypothetical protein
MARRNGNGGGWGREVDVVFGNLVGNALIGLQLWLWHGIYDVAGQITNGGGECLYYMFVADMRVGRKTSQGKFSFGMLKPADWVL